jgi:hypothetical protein
MIAPGNPAISARAGPAGTLSGFSLILLRGSRAASIRLRSCAIVVGGLGMRHSPFAGGSPPAGRALEHIQAGRVP